MKQVLKALCVMSLVLSCTITLSSYAQSDPDTLVYLFVAEDITRPFIESLDPNDGAARDDVGAIQNLYETLFGYDKDSYDLEPLLATDYTRSEDGKTYTFTLREGVKFHSGNTFSCKDVAWSFKYIFIREAGLYWFEESLLGQDYGGATAYVAVAAREAGVDVPEEGWDWDPTTWEGADAAYAAYWELVEKAIVCVDDYTFQMTLEKPDAQLLYKVAIYIASIMDSEWAIDNGEWNGEAATYRAAIRSEADFYCYCSFQATHVSSTAPYKLVSWKGDVLVAEAFEEYWGEQPSIPVVFYKKVQDVDSVFLSLQQGDADATQLGNQWNLLEGKLRGAEGTKILEEPNWFLSEMVTMTFNPDIQDLEEGGSWLRGSGQLDGAGIPRDFFTDKNVRLGIAHSFKAFIERQLLGHGQPLSMPIFPGFSSYDASLPTYDLYDPVKAEAYFRAAYDGKLWDLGFEFTVGESYLLHIPYMEQLQSDLAALNPKFKMNVRRMTEDEFLEVDEDRQPLLFYTTLADYPDYDFFSDFYESNNADISVINDEIAPLVAAATDTLDAAERKALHKRVAEIAFDDMILYVFPASQAYVVTSDALEGAYFNPYISTNFFWKDVSKK
jgi:peptide/nickel transport system substrate-binding protein